MSKSYLLWAVIAMIGYSVTATLVKLATGAADSPAISFL
jgi:hypothetical protein